MTVGHRQPLGTCFSGKGALRGGSLPRGSHTARGTETATRQGDEEDTESQEAAHLIYTGPVPVGNPPVWSLPMALPWSPSSRKSFPSLLQPGIPWPLKVPVGSSHPQPHTAPQRPHLGTNSARRWPALYSVHCQNLLVLSSPGNQVPSQSQRLALLVNRPARVRTHCSPQPLRHRQLLVTAGSCKPVTGPCTKGLCHQSACTAALFLGLTTPR